MEQGFANCTYVCLSLSSPTLTLSQPPMENHNPYQRQTCFLNLLKCIRAVSSGSKRVNCRFCVCVSLCLCVCV